MVGTSRELVTLKELILESIVGLNCRDYHRLSLRSHQRAAVPLRVLWASSFWAPTQCSYCMSYLTSWLVGSITACSAGHVSVTQFATHCWCKTVGSQWHRSGLAAIHSCRFPPFHRLSRENFAVPCVFRAVVLPASELLGTWKEFWWNTLHKHAVWKKCKSICAWRSLDH